MKAREWAKDDNWKKTRGGFNPDVFKDLDSDTRDRLRKHKVGPPIMRGDKDLSAGDVFSLGKWSEDSKGLSFPGLPYGLGSELGQHGTNRGKVQNAVWEMGLSGIETKEDLNKFLDRTEALKAEHGDFDWGPEATMLFRGQPATEESVETTPTPEPEPEHQPSQELTDTRNQWDSRGTGGSIHYDPTSGKTGPGVVGGVGAAAQYANDTSDDYHNRFIPHLNLQAKLESLEIGDAGSRHLDRYEGKVPELASKDIKDLYEYYSKKITA